MYLRFASFLVCRFCSRYCFCRSLIFSLWYWYHFACSSFRCSSDSFFLRSLYALMHCSDLQYHLWELSAENKKPGGQPSPQYRFPQIQHSIICPAPSVVRSFVLPRQYHVVVDIDAIFVIPYPQIVFKQQPPSKST